LLRGFLLHDANRPKIVGQISIEQIGVRHGEIARLSPAGAPRVAHEETLRGVVIADREHRVSAEESLGRRRQVEFAGLRDHRALERGIDRKSEDEGIARCEDPLELREGTRW
jgi:hypothetical protein